MRYFPKLIVFCFSCLFTIPVVAQSQSAQPLFTTQVRSSWVDSVFNTLTPDERIAQLLMVAAYSNRRPAHADSISKLIREYKIGGLIFFQGGPVRQARLTNRYQSESDVPLLVAIDGEWGLGMRLDSTTKFPYQMTLGAIPDNQLIYQMGAEVARQFKRMGIHVNFAPVADVNNNPRNPVISFRSFGEDKNKVAEKAIAYAKGMQDNGIMATAKHFPGHGDTDADSHYALPLINYDRQRLDSLELYPFRQLIDAGIGGMMVAHLSIPQLDSTKNLPSTLSKPIITDLLKKELGFTGLIFTDAMNMKGVTSYFPDGEADARAVIAGNDVLEFTNSVPKALAAIRQAIRKGQISQREIDERCRKILAAKQWAGLDNYQPVDTTHLIADLNPPEAGLLNRRLMESALTLLKNERNLIPLRELDTLNIATIAVGATAVTPFQQMISNYAPATHFTLPLQATAAQMSQLQERLKAYDLLLVGVHGLSIRPPRNFGITESMMATVNQLARSGKAVITVFGSAYTLPQFVDLPQTNGLLLAYQENVPAQEAAAQLLFGANSAGGKLPVTTGSFKLNDGIPANGIQRFKYTVPEAVGLNAKLLNRKVDSLVRQAIESKAIPGCQVLIAKEGNVILRKSYGFHTYDSLRPVQNTDVYDLASITKISASLPALMRLQGEGKFDVDKTPKDYLPKYGSSNKRNIRFRDILTHQGQLKAWIPFWKDTKRKNGMYKWNTFRADSSERFPYLVASNLYLHRNYRKKIYRAIRKSPLNDKPGYVYSDLSFYLYPQLVKELTGKAFETYLKETFYQPLGAGSLTYNPYRHFPDKQIVPTEYDSLFRHVLIQGRVHDEGAAMLNGLSGHAGLFGNANDLAKLMQMYLQGGTYGGEQFLKAEVLKEFARCQFCDQGNRRGIGFDKPEINPTTASNAAKSASRESFGHSGFTGTFTWIDPAQQLVYVFLSNRVYPTRNNPRLSQLNTRTNIQQVVYELIEAGKKAAPSTALPSSGK